jgi:hypothetical protein
MKKYSILSLIAFFCVVIGSSCSSNPKSFIDKRIERAKLLNDIRASEDDAKAKNKAIDNAMTDAFKTSTKEGMKGHCSEASIDSLIKAEQCYVDKLKDLKNNKAHKQESDQHRIDCYKHANKIEPSCSGAYKNLEDRLDVNTASR